MKEEVTAWEEEKQITISILDSSMPAEPGTNLEFHLEALDENSTRLLVKGNYRLKYVGILSPLIAGKSFQKLANGLAEIAKVNAEKLHQQ